MTLRRTIAALSILWCFAGTASAQTVAVNVGAINVFGVPGPEQQGFYPYVGVSAAFTSGSLSLIPALSIEASPDVMRWGFVGGVTLDYALTGAIGLDLNVTLIHDQAGGDFGGALFFLGGGPGVSFFLGRWTVSPYVSVFHGLNVSGWSLVPGINVAYALAGPGL